MQYKWQLDGKCNDSEQVTYRLFVVDESVGAEQPCKQRLLCSPGSWSGSGILKGATQTLGTGRGRGPEGS